MNHVSFEAYSIVTALARRVNFRVISGPMSLARLPMLITAVPALTLQLEAVVTVGASRVSCVS